MEKLNFTIINGKCGSGKTYILKMIENIYPEQSGYIDFSQIESKTE
jgi:ABC-type proline/glycine betaine transport system ATPase subunit